MYYYQFVQQHNPSCGVGVHRVFFVTAIIQERGGFNITREAIINGTAPTPSGPAPPSLAGLQAQNVTVTDRKTISANVGDTVTLYVKSISTNETVQPTQQFGSATGHGFELDAYGILDPNIPWGTWHAMTFTVTSQGVAKYNCAQVCSQAHGQMTGTFSAGCGA